MSPGTAEDLDLCTHPQRRESGAARPGLRWVNNGLVVTTVWHYYFDPFEPNRHYIAYTDIGYARSTDAGESWYWHTGRPFRNTTYELALDPETPGKIWAAFADLHDIPDNNVISGRHYWTRLARGRAQHRLRHDLGGHVAGPSEQTIVSVVLDPRSPKGKRTLYASAFEEGVYKSTDDGQTWERRSNGLGAPGVNMRACRIILHRDGTLFCLVTALRKDEQFVAEGPGLYRSRDGGDSWEWINAPTIALAEGLRRRSARQRRHLPRRGRRRRGWSPERGRSGTCRRTGRPLQDHRWRATWTRLARKGRDCFGATISKHHPDWYTSASRRRG